MAEEIMPEEHKILRAYILNEVGEKDRKTIEERLVTDEDFFRELSMVEEMVVQDYADGKLTQAQRVRFEKCFLISKENHQKVRFARALRKYIDETEDTAYQKNPTFFDSIKVFFLSPVPAAVAVLIILIFGGFWFWKSSSGSRAESLIALNEAFRAERPFEARITDLDYAPPKNTRGSNDENKTNKIKLDLAARIALEDADKNASAENIHALGRVYLAEKRFDEAIGQLEKAVKLAPENAKLHNDLGVALLEKAKVAPEQELLNFGKANEEFSKAIELDKNLLDAYFNRALTIQDLNLPNQAREAWQKYLELDPDSKWAEEARKHLETLASAQPLGKNKDVILQEFLEAERSGDHERAWQTLSRTREIPDKLIHQQIIFSLVDAKARGDEVKSKKSLNSLIYAGKLEEKRSGDLYWRDLAHYYGHLTDDKIPLLKEAQDYVREGYKQWSERELGKSSESFEKAIGLFTKADNNLETRICEYLILNTLFQFSRVKESNELYLKLAESSKSQQYKWLATQSYTRLAYGTGSENKLSNSIEYINKALELAKQTDDSYNQQRLYSMLGDRYRQLGRFDLSLKYFEQSLEIANLPEASRRQTWTDYEAATQTFFAKRFFKTAVIFQKEALKLSRDIEVRFFEQYSNSYIGMIYSADNKFAEAEPFFLESISIAETFEEQIRTKNIALAKLKYADFKRDSGKYDEALALYDEVSGFHSSSEFQREKYACQKGKLLCYIQMRNDSAVQNQLPVMLEIFKNYRGKIFEEQNRNSFFDRNQDVYDLAVNYEYDNADYEKAFNYSEDSRSRSLLDLINSNETISGSDSESAEIKFLKPSSEPLKISEIQPQIPEQVQLLQYNVLKDKIIIWLITGKDFQPVHTEIDIQELQDSVFSYLNVLRNQDDEEKEKELSRRLYQILIAPIEGKLDGNKKICLIPDKFLFHLPFAALISEKTKRYLVYDHEIFYAPSANVFLLNTDEARKHKSNSDETLLSIGNPAFSQKNFPDLPKLASAEKEAAEIDGFYKNPIPLIGQAASKKNVEQNFTKSDVIHFAGHYVVNEQNSSLSGFLLAENGSYDKQESLLTSSEILNIKLPKTKLIVLSACQTGVEGFYQGEGIIGAARTFLANKVPLVVASQWAVDSDSTKDLMVSFHRNRKRENLSTAAALRKAQLEMLGGQDKKFQHPYFWAGFMTLGGYAEF